MSENQQIAIVEPTLAPADVFQSLTNGYGFDNFKAAVEKYIKQQSTIVADINTATGRAAVISAAAAVKACKSPLNKVALEQARILEGKPKEIRANLKIIEQMLDDGAESIRKPVTDFEQPRKDRIQAIKNSAVFDGFVPDSVAIQSRLDWLNAVVMDKEFFKDFFSAANKEKNAATEKLTALLHSTVAAENQARELAEAQAKANRADWVNQISAKGLGLENLQMYQLQTRRDEIIALGNGITSEAYVEQYEPAINAQKTALSLVNLAIETLKEVDARAKRQAELKQLLSLPAQAQGMTPEAIQQTIEKLTAINYKADYCKELYGDFVDGKAKVLSELESIKAQKIADAEKAKVEAEAQAAEKARLEQEKMNEIRSKFYDQMMGIESAIKSGSLVMLNNANDFLHTYFNRHAVPIDVLQKEFESIIEGKKNQIAAAISVAEKKSNQEHRKKIENEIYCYLAKLIGKEHGQIVAQSLVDNEVPHVSINC